MKKIQLLIAFSIAATSAAFAGEPKKAPPAPATTAESVILTIDEGNRLAGALAKLDGYTQKDGTVTPFDFSGTVRIALFRDVAALRGGIMGATLAAQQALGDIQKKYGLIFLPEDSEHKGQLRVDVKQTKPENIQAGLKEINDAAAVPFTVQLTKISVDDLNMATNPIPASIAPDLQPILK